MMNDLLLHTGSTPDDPNDHAGAILNPQDFVAGLAGLPREEIQKAKILFIRNAISAYKDARRRKLADLLFPAIIGPAFFLLVGAFAMASAPEMEGPSPLLFFMIPAGFLWVMAIIQLCQMNSSLKFHKEKIRNAIEVWRGDLGKETFNLDF